VCIYAYSMDVRQLVTNVKGSAAMSIRRWAAEAGVAGSTITRIQAGAVDPTVHTLARMLDVAGFELHVVAVRSGIPPRPRLADLANAWTRHRGQVRLDWTRWRQLLDALLLHPELTPEAIYIAPPPAGEKVVDVLLAAVAEKLADDAGLPRPGWTEAVPALDEPYRPPVVRVVERLDVPPQLAARRVMIDAASLWRDGETIGA
jgi:hypothetical protein